MELTYHRSGDYLFPNLILKSEAAEHVGKYGLLRKQYLKEHNTNWYKSMLLTGKLDRHLVEIDRSAQARIDMIIEELSKANPSPDKEADPLSWAAHMNNLKAMAEEIVLEELVYA